MFTYLFVYYNEMFFFSFYLVFFFCFGNMLFAMVWFSTFVTASLSCIDLPVLTGICCLDLPFTAGVRRFHRLRFLFSFNISTTNTITIFIQIYLWRLTLLNNSMCEKKNHTNKTVCSAWNQYVHTTGLQKGKTTSHSNGGRCGACICLLLATNPGKYLI